MAQVWTTTCRLTAAWSAILATARCFLLLLVPGAQQYRLYQKAFLFICSCLQNFMSWPCLLAQCHNLLQQLLDQHDNCPQICFLPSFQGRSFDEAAYDNFCRSCKCSQASSTLHLPECEYRRSIRLIWRCRVILDEAHIIRNRNRQAPKACGALQAQRRWCLTGKDLYWGKSSSSTHQVIVRECGMTIRFFENT